MRISEKFVLSEEDIKAIEHHYSYADSDRTLRENISLFIWSAVEASLTDARNEYRDYLEDQNLIAEENK